MTTAAMPVEQAQRLAVRLTPRLRVVPGMLAVGGAAVFGGGLFLLEALR